MLLKDKVAIVTGAAMGMGKGIATMFAQHGCAVAIADISIDAARKTAEEIEKSGGRCVAIECDVTNISSVKSAVEQVVKKYGTVDILVNNAGGINLSSPALEDITEEEWDKVYALNLKSDFFFCKFVLPIMKKKKYGKIINLSSVGAIQPPAHVSHYNSAKSAVIGFTLDLATAVAPLNINVNAILPGPIRTEFYRARTGSMTAKEQDDFFGFLGTKVPMQRIGTPEDIGGAALFLASELSSFITGQSLLVSGGAPLANVPPAH